MEVYLVDTLILHIKQAEIFIKSIWISDAFVHWFVFYFKSFVNLLP